MNQHERSVNTRIEQDGTSEYESHPQAVISTREKKQKMGEAVLAVDYQGEVRYWANSYNTTEGQFKQFTQRLKTSDLELSPERYRENVRRYEDDLSIDWKRSEEAVADLQRHGRAHNSYDIAALQNLGNGVAPEDTIEAATGIFYQERAEQLSQALRGAGDDGKEGLRILGRTWRRVMEYLEATHDYELLHEDYHSYQNGRRAAHNEMIRQLNTINGLAEQYHTPRFTVRNFMTNDFYYDARRDHGRALDYRANYDRESVMGYFSVAFRQDFEREQRRGERREARFY